MDLKQLTDRAKALFVKRGGTQSAKEDASELRDIYKGEGSTSDKLKRSAAAIKEPGAHHEEAAAPGATGPGTEPAPGGPEQTP